MARESSSTQYALDVDRTFEDLVQRMVGRRLGLVPGRDTTEDGTAWIPSIDVVSRGNDLVIRAELPGIDPERDIEISVQGHTLTIRGERRQERREDGEHAYRTELLYGAFMRAVPLPDGVKPEDIRATYEDGVLEIVVPNATATATTRKVPITAGSTGSSGSAGGTSKGGRSRASSRTTKREDDR
jgi:HSP20 family protein